MFRRPYIQCFCLAFKARLRLLVLVASFILTASSTSFASPLGGTYTINGALPAGGSNYQSFTAAVSALVAEGVNGHVLFNVASGTYNEQISIPVLTYYGAPSSGQWTVTFDGGAGNAASRIISRSVGSSYQSVITLNGADYFRFKNLTVNSTHSSYGYCFLFTNTTGTDPADYNEISNCVLNVPVNSTSSYHIPIVASSTTSYSSYGNWANYNLIKENALRCGYYGIRWNGSGSSSLTENVGNEFIGNSILDWYYYGVYMYYGAATKLIGNRIEQRSTPTSIGTGLYLYYQNDGPEIVGNYVRSASTGIYTNYMNLYRSATSVRGKIVNNMIVCIGTSSIRAMQLRNPRFTDMVYNSVFTKTTSTAYGMYHLNSSSSDDNKVLNNFVAHKGNSTWYPFYSASSTNIFSSYDHNGYYKDGTGNPSFYWNGTTYTSLTALQSATTTVHDNSVWGNPNYFSETDLHSTSLAGHNAGTPFAGITDDFDGDTRSTTAPDIGADEFSGGGCVLSCPADVTVSNDAGACGANVNFTPPAGTGCGTVSLSHASGSFFPIGTTTVTASVTGGPQCSFTVTVQDLEAPVITAPDVPSGTEAGACGAYVSFAPTATDNCPGVGAVLCNPPSGSWFSIGSTTVTCTVTDAHGNSANETFDVIVTDTEAPVISLNQNATLWAPNHSYVTFTVADMVSAITDNCDVLSSADVEILGASSDEIEAGPGAGSGNTLDDIVIAQDCRSISVRSEREGTGDGRVYSVTLRVLDDAGNGQTATFRICVPHSVNASCTEGSPQYAVNSACGTPKAATGEPVTGKFELLQNYPNPFNPSTTIPFMLHSGGPVTLRVYSVHGRLVRTLVDEVLSAGAHRATFDARDLPSGPYLYRLKAEGITKQRVLSLVR